MWRSWEICKKKLNQPIKPTGQNQEVFHQFLGPVTTFDIIVFCVDIMWPTLLLTIFFSTFILQTIFCLIFVSYTEHHLNLIRKWRFFYFHSTLIFTSFIMNSSMLYFVRFLILTDFVSEWKIRGQWNWTLAFPIFCHKVGNGT